MCVIKAGADPCDGATFHQSRSWKVEKIKHKKYKKCPAGQKLSSALENSRNKICICLESREAGEMETDGTTEAGEEAGLRPHRHGNPDCHNWQEDLFLPAQLG